ncbi:hypothetical protein [Allosphingosinicella deserti]|uniref:Uncharacterized protein n=1 Tax=Allosphingosinicella deserti TaxID=2116704 RepID=A0A2P7QLK6_9SPHN|nr:hypothetical protein [Sphingomonas deserti]PSJ38824.1 hypothetical protein C7I55_15975 [Sphingomonas deserti]
MSVGTELLAVPFPEMIQRLGVGVAEAQLQMDMVSLRIARLMAGYDETEDDGDVEDAENLPEDAGVKSPRYLIDFGDGNSYSLLELGFTPTFYQFVDTVIELKMSISMTRTTEAKLSRSSTTAKAKGFAVPFAAGGSVSTSSVSASFASKYQYSAEGSSLMRTKLVPVPPPAVLEERIRALLAKRAAPEA